MDHTTELQALRKARFTSTEAAEQAIPAWLKSAATFQPNSTDLLMRERRYRCKPALLFQAGWIIHEYIIRTRSEEVRRDKWHDYVEVYVSTDYALSYTYRDGIIDAVEHGRIALAPQAQEEINALIATNQ